MLEANRRRVQNLSGFEIWLFIVGRALVAFALGVFAMMYLPAFAAIALWPSLVIGLVLLIIAARGLLRKGPPA